MTLYILLAVHIFILWPLGTFLTAYWWKKNSYSKTLKINKLFESIVYGAIPVIGIMIPIFLLLQDYISEFLKKNGVDWDIEIWK